MKSEIKEKYSERYKKSVAAACDELEEMQAPTPTWPEHAAVIITKNLTPLFRELRDEARNAQSTAQEQSAELEMWRSGAIVREEDRDEIMRLADALREIDDVTGFDYPSMPEHLRFQAHEIMREIVVRCRSDQPRRWEIEIEWQHEDTGARFTKRIPEGEPIPTFPRRNVIAWRVI